MPGSDMHDLPTALSALAVLVLVVTCATPGGATTRFSTSIYCGQIPAASRTSDDLATVIVLDFPLYNQTNISKAFALTSAGDDGTNSLWSRVQGVFVQDALPVTRIDLFDDVGASLGPRSRAELWATP